MRIPFLKNFRRGFATNSSSSHSFVYLKSASPDAHDDTNSADAEFGWNDFRLSTIREKLFYVLVGRITGGWKDKVDGEQAYEDLHEEYPELSKEDFIYAAEGYVDHESYGTIGAAEARDPRVIVFGGNDNSGESAERAAVVRSGEVDWSITEMDWEDADNISPNDVEGLKLAQEFRQRGW